MMKVASFGTVADDKHHANFICAMNRGVLIDATTCDFVELVIYLIRA